MTVTTVRYRASRHKKQTDILSEQTGLAQHTNSHLARIRAARLNRRYSLSNSRVVSRKTYISAKPALHVQKMRIKRDIRQVKQTLAGLVEKREANRWLAAPNPILDGISPLDKISQGKTEQVMEVLACLAEGIYV